jgi:arylsulfatase A-like enzyme
MLLVFLSGVISFLVFLGSWEDTAEAETATAALATPMIEFVARVGLAHLFEGLVAGGAAAALAWWAFPGRRGLGSALLLGAVFVYIFGRDVVHRPVFYEPYLYQTGGILRALMSGATDHLTPRAFDVTALLVLAGLLALGAWRRRRAARTLGGAAAGLAVVLVLIDWRLGDEPPPPRTLNTFSEHEARTGSKINLVLLGADSLRPDRLHACGCERVVVPHIDALAETGVVFRNAFVPLARTAPSLVSLFTGADPHTHGIRHMFPPRHRRVVRLPTLPRVLAGHGYRSEVVTDYAGDVFNQIDLGFDAVHGPPALNLLSLAQYEILRRTPAFLPFFNHPAGHAFFPVLRTLPANADPEWLADRLLDRLDALDRSGRPFCLTGFFTGPHTPYATRHPGYRLFADPAYQGPNKYAYFVRSLEQFDRLEERLPEPEIEQIRALYDGACRLTDRAIGRVVGEIVRRGLWSRTVIVVFSDHGESLYEARNTTDHGKWFRGDKANRIPLILAGGPVESLAGNVDGLVRNTDVLPTLLALLGIEKPPTVEGVDLGPRMRGEPVEPLTSFAETGIWLGAPTTFRGANDAMIYPPVDRILMPDEEGVLVLREAYNEIVEEAKHRCLRTDEWKLVYIPTEHGVRYELYDVKRDPDNLENLAAKRPWRVMELSRRLRHWMLGDPGKRFDERGHLVPDYRYFE